jgi:hypothetical protein
MNVTKETTQTNAKTRLQRPTIIADPHVYHPRCISYNIIFTTITPARFGGDTSHNISYATAPCIGLRGKTLGSIFWPSRLDQRVHTRAAFRTRNIAGLCELFSRAHPCHTGAVLAALIGKAR